MDRNFLIYFGLLLAIIGSIIVVLAIVHRLFNFFMRAKISKIEEEIFKLERGKEELENSFKNASKKNDDLLKINEGYRRMLNIPSMNSTNGEEIFDALLVLGLELVPEAQAGSISLLSGKRWKFVAAKGHDRKGLMNLDLKSDWMIHEEKIEVVENIIEKNDKMPKEVLEKLSAATLGPIYGSLFVPIEINGHFTGNFCFDALQDLQFSRSSMVLMEAFRKIVSNFITLKNLESLESVDQNRFLRTIVNLHEMKNLYMRGHSERVAFLASKIAEKMNLSPKEVDTVYWAGIFHDIGKISIPDEVMKKPSKMTEEEFEMMKTHTIASEKLLSEGKNLNTVSLIARHHHESFDGTGYPDGLSGSEIPFSARILSVADSFDALMRPEPYGESLNPDEAVERLKALSGTKFDPEIVDSALMILEEYSNNMKSRTPVGISEKGRRKPSKR